MKMYAKPLQEGSGGFHFFNRCFLLFSGGIPAMRAVGTGCVGNPMRLPVRDDQGLLLWQQPPFSLIDFCSQALVDRCQFRRFFRQATECAGLDAMKLGKRRKPDRPRWVAALRKRRLPTVARRTPCQALDELLQVLPTGSCHKGGHELLKLEARLSFLLDLTFEQTSLRLQLRAPALEGRMLLSDLLAQDGQLSQDIARDLLLRAELLPDLLQGINGAAAILQNEGVYAGDRHFAQAAAVVDCFQFTRLDESIGLTQRVVNALCCLFDANIHFFLLWFHCFLPLDSRSCLDNS